MSVCLGQKSSFRPTHRGQSVQFPDDCYMCALPFEKFHDVGHNSPIKQWSASEENDNKDLTFSFMWVPFVIICVCCTSDFNCSVSWPK